MLLAIFMTAAGGLLYPVKAGGAKRLSPRQFAAVVDARKLMDNGNPDRAAALLLPFAQGKEPPLGILSHLAWAKSMSGDSDAALDIYEQAVSLYPDDAGSRRNLGIMLLDLNRPADAAEALIQAYDLLPEDAQEPALLAQAASALVRIKSFDRALSLLDRADRDAHEIPLSWTSLAVYCCQQIDDLNGALDRTLSCTMQHPESAAAWKLLSRVRLLHSDPLLAAAALETAQALQQHNVVAGSSAHQSDISAELAALYALGHAHAEAAQRLAKGHVPESSLKAAEFFYMAKQNQAALKELDEFAANQSLSGGPKGRILALRAALLRGRILLDMGDSDSAVFCLLEDAAKTPGFDAPKDEHCFRGTSLLLAGEIRWLEKNWNEAARIFDLLAAVPGFSDTGTTLAAGMRAILRESILGKMEQEMVVQ
ncbi:MAG: hypothetical protein KVP17_003134 [Porospora cf. gigantea B]|uniref:uncharacterized protein n=1 Tax=Porospora cf. gigantea B TaxID=2853592 RepID=UPI003571A2A4|nr:MAG: hypothetical protein KVP17_003134 [Porospora cf. gigantea B]